MLRTELGDALYAIVRVIIPFLRSLIIAAALVLSGMALEWLVGFTLPKESQSYRVVEFVLDLSLVGSAIVVATCGALIVAWDAITSTRDFISPREAESMSGRLLNNVNVNEASPVDPRLLLYGAVIGVVYGLSKLGDSADEATAQGISMYIVVTLAVWLGLKLCRVVLMLNKKQIDSLAGRLTALESRLEQGDDDAPDRRTGRRLPVWLTVVRFCICTTPVGIVVCIGGVIMAFIDLQVDLYTIVQYVPSLIFGALYFSLCIGFQWAYIWKTGRSISRLEQSSDSIDGVALNTQKLASAISRTHSVCYKVTGQRLTA